MSGHLVMTCSLACKSSCSSSIITFDRCRNKVIFQVLLDNARIKGFWGEQSFESIGLFATICLLLPKLPALVPFRSACVLSGSCLAIIMMN